MIEPGEGGTAGGGTRSPVGSEVGLGIGEGEWVSVSSGYALSQKRKVGCFFSLFLLWLCFKIFVRVCCLSPSFQFSSAAQSCPTLCNPTDRSTPGLCVHHQVPELAQTHVHRVSDAIQPSHPLSSPSPPALSLSQHQGLFQGVSSLHQVARVLEFQLQHQSFP